MSRRTAFQAVLVCAVPVCALAVDPPVSPAPEYNFALRDPVVRAIVRNAAEPAKGAASKGVNDGEIPASMAALKMAPTLLRARTPAVPQESTCTPVASGGPRGAEMQHVGIASDPLQSWVATQAGYIKGSKGGGSWPCSTHDAGLPSPWAK
jgi:hypothetical protein